MISTSSVIRIWALKWKIFQISTAFVCFWLRFDVIDNQMLDFDRRQQRFLTKITNFNAKSLLDLESFFKFVLSLICDKIKSPNQIATFYWCQIIKILIRNFSDNHWNEFKYQARVCRGWNNFLIFKQKCHPELNRTRWNWKIDKFSLSQRTWDRRKVWKLLVITMRNLMTRS